MKRRRTRSNRWAAVWVENEGQDPVPLVPRECAVCKRRREETKRAVEHLISAYKLSRRYVTFNDLGGLLPVAGIRAHIDEVFRILTGEKIDEALEKTDANL